MVAPSLNEDELVRSQDVFDGVYQPVPIHEPIYLGLEQPPLSEVLRGGGPTDLVEVTAETKTGSVRAAVIEA